MFGHGDLEHPFTEYCIHPGGVGVFRESEGPEKGPVRPFQPVDLPSVFFCLRFPFTADGQPSVFQSYLHVLFAHLRQFCGDEVLRGIFHYVNEWSPRWAFHIRAAVGHAGSQGIEDSILQVFDLPKGIPSHNRVHRVIGFGSRGLG